jgi:hypothetical protein
MEGFDTRVMTFHVTLPALFCDLQREKFYTANRDRQQEQRRKIAKPVAENTTLKKKNASRAFHSRGAKTDPQFFVHVDAT